MEFPQYRKYLNGMSYFKILSPEEFFEYKLSAKGLEEYHFQAQILPDRNYVHDMLHDYEQHWAKIEEDSFLTFLESNS